MKTSLLKKLIILVLSMCLIVGTVFVTAYAIESQRSSETTPSLEIVTNNVSYSDSLYILYAVANDGFDRDDHEIKMLFWDEVQTEYTLGTEVYSVTDSGDKVVKEKDCLIFYSDGIAAKEMTDDIYARACVVIDEKEYYSDVMKFSVLEYVYRMREQGKGDNNLFTEMLEYGAAAQQSFTYNTGRPADADYYMINVVSGKLPDGFGYGLYLANDEVTITANEPVVGMKFVGWMKDSTKEIISEDMTTVIEVKNSDETYTAVYTGEVSATKISTYTKGRTVAPGDKITYFIVVDNDSKSEQSVTVNDSVPANTTYVSGADTNTDGALAWNITVPAGSTATVSYTVRVDDDTALCDGGYIAATTATVGDSTAMTNDIYVERTINSFDAKYMNIAIDALSGSNYKDRVLVYWMYYVFCSQEALGSTTYGSDFATTISMILDGSASDKLLDAIAPTLYGGNSISGAIAGVKGAPASKVLESDLVVGDVIIAKTGSVTRSYVYGDNGLFELTEGFSVADKNAVLASLTETDAYAVIRPSINLTTYTPTDEEATPDVLNEKQQALMDTAIYYMMRGQWLQYDDTYYQYATTSTLGGNESRWSVSQYTPEEYTRDNWGYINCAAFTSDVYWTTFGQKIGMHTTSDLASKSAGKGMLVYNFTRTASQSHTDEEKAEVTEAFLSNLQPGDLMVVRRGTSSGHVMMYIGNGAFIHSSGSNYDHNDVGEKYDVTIRFHKVYDYFLSGNNQNGYIFGTQVTQLCIVRPLQSTTYSKYNVSSTAQARLDNLQGIVAEKLVSVKEGVSVNPGDEITYTIRIKNTNTSPVTLNVSDVVPEYTTYVSGGDTVDGNNLSWVVTVPARETVDITFTVKVNEGVAFGTEILNNGAEIAGVPFKTYHTIVNGTLTAEQQQKLVETFNSMKSGNTLTGFAFVNALYRQAFDLDYDIFASTDLDTVCHDTTDGVFTAYYNDTKLPQMGGKDSYTINTGSKYNKFLVDNLYGGRRLATGSAKPNRNPLVTVDHLVVGDIFFRRISSGTIYTYLYIGGDYFVNISTKALAFETTTANRRMDLGHCAAYYYGVIRPSYGMNEE